MSEIPSEHQLYQAYSIEEETERVNVHYEQDAQFYYWVTGGQWNVYSSQIWANEQTTMTEAQEAKLDLMAQCMELQPGMRIMDVGCGWGGPLTYLCKKYGVSGVGLTLSPKQKAAADARIAKHGVNAEIKVCHWKEYQDDQLFDAICTDEVIVHFHDLQDFFNRAWQLLKMGGRLVNKELHFSHQKHARLGRTGEQVQSVYGYTGNYRLLAEELQMLNDSAFELSMIHQLPIRNYKVTMDYWLKQLFEHRAEMKAMVGERFYLEFRKYLKIYRWAFDTGSLTLDIVASRKIDPD